MKGAMENYIVHDRAGQAKLIALICSGAFIANLDATIVNITLPTLSREFGVSPSAIAWVVLSYLICETGFMLPFGRMAQIRGIKSVYLAGFVIFMIGSVLCGISTRIGELIASRAMQGLGGAMLFTVMLAFIPIYLPPELRVKATGIATMAAALGVGFGPPLGGWIASSLGWRWIFFVNIPFCLAAIFFTIRCVPDACPRSEDRRFDYAGTFLSFAALLFFLFSVNMGGEFGWGSPVLLGYFALAASLAALFILRERRIDYPLLDFTLFKNRDFLFSVLAFSASIMTVGGVTFIFPFYLEEHRGMGADVAGMLMVLLCLGQFIGPYSGRLSGRFGITRVCTTGMAFGILAFVFFLRLGQMTSLAFIMVALTIFGLSQGVSKAPNIALIMGYPPVEKKSSVGSLITLTRSLSIAIGVLFFETVFSDSIPHHISHNNMNLAQGISDPEQLAPGFRNVFLFGAALSIAAVILIRCTREPAKEGSR